MRSCDIEVRFDIDATRGTARRELALPDRSGCRMISRDRTADQSHEYLGCNDFFGQGSTWLRKRVNHFCCVLMFDWVKHIFGEELAPIPDPVSCSEFPFCCSQ